MGTRTRLFASAAFPLLSLSLMLQPAQAALLQGSGISAVAKPVASAATFEVAQAAEPAQDEQDPRKKKKPQGEEEAQPPKKEPEQKHEKPAEAPKQPAAESEAPKPPNAAEPEAPKPPKAVQQEVPKPPKAAQPEAPAAAEPEAQKPPKHNKPSADAAEPAAPKPAAAEPEAAPVKPKAAAEPTAPAAEPETQPQGNKHHKPNGQAQPETAPAAGEPAAPAAQSETAPAQPPKKHQKPTNGTEQPAQPQAAPAAAAAPGETPAKPPKPAVPNAEAPAQPAAPAAPNAEAPVAPKAEGTKPVKPEGEPKPGANGQKPAVSGEQPAPVTPGEKPAPAAPGEKPAAAVPGQPPAPAAPGEKPAPGTPPAQAPANGKPAPAEAPAAPAQTGGAAPQVAPSTAGEQVSPAEIEKRKKIADNPAAAGNGAGPVILPVQNGTAVLDSDKDSARHGHHGQPGDGKPAPDGQAPVGQAPGQPAPGQVRQDQRPPAPENVRAPTSDADSQRMPGGKQAPPVRIQAVTSEQGRRMDQRPDFAAPDGAQIEDRQNSRVIINFGDDTFVRHDDTQRFTRDGERPTYEQLPRNRYRETIDRPDGTRIVTVRNRYGDIIQRSRIDGGGREYVLFYSPELENQPNQDDYYRDPGDQLPPMRLRIPLNQYIIDTSEDQNQDYYDFLRKPPVEPVERVYSLNEVRYSARIRDKVRRIDLDTITFATGSADIPMVQAKTIRGIAEAIGNIIKKDPSETFLIEGHTDAVGSDQSNLILSDQRAESVANVLTDVYGIPPENLATQGYGEQYLKINTDGPEQENRRVTIRRVTALVRPVAAK